MLHARHARFEARQAETLYLLAVLYRAHGNVDFFGIEQWREPVVPGTRLNPFAHMPSAFRWQLDEWPTGKIPGLAVSQPLPKLTLYTGCSALTEAPSKNSAN
jgi:hypothetical protein